MTYSSEPKYIDPRKIYADELQSWKDFWDNKNSLFENVENIISQAIFLPNKSLTKLATLYCLLPTKWSKVVPILLSYGMRGSGKSTIAILANSLHGYSQPFAPTDTFASLRNSLNSRRWIDPDSQTWEREGCLMAWDNIYIDTLLGDQKVYQMILGGYNRMTSKIQIANNDGTNLSFDVYCPKIISSVDPIHLHPSMSELQRRLIVIPHKPFDKFTKLEKLQYEGLDIISDKIDIDSVSWLGMSDQFYKFWDDSTGIIYAKKRSSLTKKGNQKTKLPKHFTGERWTISVDLITTGLITGCFKSDKEAIDYFSEYWELADKSIFGDASPLLDHLRQFIKDEAEFKIKENVTLEAMGMETLPVKIEPSKLKARVKQLTDEGALETNPKQELVLQAMLQLGWKLSEKGWVQI